MNFKAGYTEQEGFLGKLLLRADNGLVLATEELIWKGKVDRDLIVQRFFETARALGADNLEKVAKKAKYTL